MAGKIRLTTGIMILQKDVRTSTVEKCAVEVVTVLLLDITHPLLACKNSCRNSNYL